MKPANRSRPWLETLEDRVVPAVSATVLPGGLLYVVDTVAPSSVGPIRIIQTANNTFNVFDGATQINGAPLVATNVRIALSSASDDLRIDLNGKIFNGSVVAFLGAGVNTATVYGNEFGAGQGTINGFLQIYGGLDIDTVNLDGSNVGGLKVGMATTVNLDGNVVDFLNTTGSVSLNGGLATYYVNWINLNSGTAIGQSAFLYGGSGGNTVNLAAGASVAKNFSFAGYFSVSNGGNSVTVDGTVGQDLIFNSSVNNIIGHSLTLNGSVARDLLFYGGSQGDTLDVNPGATVGRNLVAYTGAGDDTVTLDGTVGTAVATGAVYLFLGAGNDTATLNSTIGFGVAATQVLFIDAGAGNDAVTLGASASIQGKALVLLGSGADAFTRTPGAVLLGVFLLDGGAGVDAFFGSPVGITSLNIP
jgi:hypothetical protein